MELITPMPRYRRNQSLLDQVGMLLAIGTLMGLVLLIADALFNQTRHCPAPKAFPIVGELPHVDS